MTPALVAATGMDEYDALPAAIRDAYSLKEWLWLSGYEKATLVKRECEPEWDE